MTTHDLPRRIDDVLRTTGYITVHWDEAAAGKCVAYVDRPGAARHGVRAWESRSRVEPVVPAARLYISCADGALRTRVAVTGGWQMLPYLLFFVALEATMLVAAVMADYPAPGAAVGLWAGTLGGMLPAFGWFTWMRDRRIDHQILKSAEHELIRRVGERGPRGAT